METYLFWINKVLEHYKGAILNIKNFHLITTRDFLRTITINEDLINFLYLFWFNKNTSNLITIRNLFWFNKWRLLNNSVLLILTLETNYLLFLTLSYYWNVDTRPVPNYLPHPLRYILQMDVSNDSSTHQIYFYILLFP